MKSKLAEVLTNCCSDVTMNTIKRTVSTSCRLICQHQQLNAVWDILTLQASQVCCDPRATGKPKSHSRWKNTTPKAGRLAAENTKVETTADFEPVTGIHRIDIKSFRRKVCRLKHHLTIAAVGCRISLYSLL